MPLEWIKAGIRAAWLVCVVIWLFPAAALAEADVQPKRVLVLYWYNKDYSWNVNFDREFQAALQSAPSGPFEYYPEYLESDRFPGEYQSQLLHNHLRMKYAERPIDVVVATSDVSLNFLFTYRTDLFPRAPIVFTATRRPTTEQLDAGPGITGLIILTDHRQTVDLALKLHPDTKHIFIVSGTLEHDKRLETLARQQLQGYESRIEIEYLTDLQPEELIAKTKELPEGSLVLYVWQQSRTEQGRVLETQEILASFAPSVRVPIYGMTNLDIGRGAVGGYINLAETTGAKAGQIATQVANGTSAYDIPVENAPLTPIFDWRQIRRWGISEGLLPPGSVVRFKELSFWEQYRWQIAGVISLCLVEALLIFGLLAQRAKRSRAEEGLNRAEEKYHSMFEHAIEGIFQTTPDGQYITANPALARMLGYDSPEELINRRTDIERQQYVEPERRSEFKRLLEEHGVVRSFEYQAYRKDGHKIWLSDNVRSVRDESGAVLYYEGSAEDITDRKAAEETLKATSEQLRALSARLQSAREDEGTRIAREIHDELGSALTSLRWDLESFDKSISESGDPEALRERIAAMLKIAEATIGSVRRISSELRPKVLDDLGLAAAIEWQARQFQMQTGISTDCDLSLEDGALDREKSTAVFRIFQEAMTNIRRHAAATSARISLRDENGWFVLTISDNGKGIAEDEKSATESLGILGMHERAHLIGGQIDITGAEGKGTVVTVRVPLFGSQGHDDEKDPHS